MEFKGFYCQQKHWVFNNFLKLAICIIYTLIFSLYNFGICLYVAIHKNIGNQYDFPLNENVEKNIFFLYI